MTDPIRKNEAPHVGASHDSVVRVVLAEVDGPGSLHYLLESEGFLVVARASDEAELARVLDNGLDPDVVVLDTDISVESVLIARQRAPSAHVIVLWPDGVQNLPNTERIAPWLVYELLGPAIRRAVRERPQRQAIEDSDTTEHPSSASDEPIVLATDPSPRRAASRVSVASIVLIGVLLLTMGGAMALDGWHVRLPWNAPRTEQAAHQAPTPNGLTATPAAGRAQHDTDPANAGSCRPTGDGTRRGPNTHASSAAAAHLRTCPTHNGGSDNKPGHPGKPAHPSKPDHPGKPDHPAKNDHAGGHPHDSSGTPTEHASGNKPDSPDGPASPPGKSEHRPS